MNLKIAVPKRVLVDEEAQKVAAEAANGSFVILPRHIDFVTVLVPGILSYVSGDGRESFMAVDEAILVKCGDQVSVSAMDAVKSESLETLHRTLQEQFLARDERERKSRTVLTRLETTVARRFMEMTKYAG
jgi:F-type H+-transporting ATPase subunit epsilon